MESLSHAPSAAANATSPELTARSDAPADSPVSQLLRQLQEERARREHLERVLALRNCALDAATAHFMITEATRAGGRIVYVNRALARDHGYEPAELLGQSPGLLAPAELNTTERRALEHAVRNGASLRTELRSRRKDGSTFWTGIALEPIRDAAGCLTHYVSIGADITARLAEARETRRLQDQLLSEMRERERMAIELRFAQKLEAVGRLAAGIAHEINTPVQYLGDGVTFLQSGLPELQSLLDAYQAACTNLVAGHRAQEVLEEIQRVEAGIDVEFLRSELPRAIERMLEGVARVAGIVRAMKEFAHPDSSEQSAADLNHALETTLTVARSEYKYVATIETQFGAIPEVLCNIGELNQVFLNLIVNAAHAIESAGKDASSGRIQISTAEAGSCVEIIIADNGCGIPEEHLEKIFDPFFTTKEVGKGTGQGLAIARSMVVDKHGGSIDVMSEPNVGTQFRLRLPIAGRHLETRS